MRNLALCALALMACAGASDETKLEPKSKPSHPTPPLGEEELAAAKDCVENLLLFADSGSEGVSDFLSHCARKMGFPRLSEIPEKRRWLALAEKSDLVCSKSAGQKAGIASGAVVLQSLVEECGPDYFGLPADAKDIMTFQWFLAQRTAAWLAQAQDKLGKGHEKLLVDLGKAQRQYSALVPLPTEVAGHYRLPGKGVDSNFSNSTTYVLLAPQGTFVGTTPRMRLTPEGAVW
ncbi:MAG: hypothetical protein GY811_24865 [Myxococcales bacterium]|nr:hypothetical protein [Myxococcales bacterium]